MVATKKEKRAAAREKREAFLKEDRGLGALSRYFDKFDVILPQEGSK